MEPKHFTIERSQQIVISVLKANGIRKVIASPGTTNVTLVGSMQNDPWFEMYSSVDERSAAYMACGLAEESGEPVVITCTGATASRDYMPGLTEAFYRKLPVLAITANQGTQRVGHLLPQNIDRSVLPKDVVKMSVSIGMTTDAESEWANNILANKAVLELFHHGGGPVHINLSTGYNQDFSIEELPATRIIRRFMPYDSFPEIPEGRIAVFVGSHHKFTEKQAEAIDAFCATYDAVVLTDKTSGYVGKYAVNFALIGAQRNFHSELASIRLLIHIGEVSGDYYGTGIAPDEVWRVNEDGEIRDTFRRLTAVFEMPEHMFFSQYSRPGCSSDTLLKQYKALYNEIAALVPELPFCNAWIAQHTLPQIPSGAVLHLGILNSLRSWNWFTSVTDIDTYSNVGGFGIDGPVSTIIGASLASPDRIHFLVVGDLAFFYDMNAVGNRHVGSNVRIMLINNGRGAEFRLYSHPCFQWGDKADPYMAAAGHFGNQHPQLVKCYAENLGYDYISASNKDEFNNEIEKFISPDKAERPMIFEVFTNKQDESDALHTILNLVYPREQKIKDGIKEILPDSIINIARKFLKR